MNLDEFLPVVNNSLNFFINKRGFITVDEYYHPIIFKLTIVHYWQRFIKVVGKRQLWSILKSFSDSDVFEFNENGTPHDQPSSILYIINREKEYKVFKSIFEKDNSNSNSNYGGGGGTNKKSILFGFLSNYKNFIIIACFTIMSIYYYVYNEKSSESERKLLLDYSLGQSKQQQQQQQQSPLPRRRRQLENVVGRGMKIGGGGGNGDGKTNNNFISKYIGKVYPRNKSSRSLLKPLYDSIVMK